MLPKDLLNEFRGKELLDFGLSVSLNRSSSATHCVAPNSLVLSYTLGIEERQSRRILLAGIDGYQSGDPRNDDIVTTLLLFSRLLLLPYRSDYTHNFQTDYIS